MAAPAPATAPRVRPGRIDPWAVLPAVLFLALVFIAVFGDRIAPHEPFFFTVEHGHDPRPFEPGLVYPLGSDMLGRDLASVVLAGARWTLTIVLAAGLARVVTGLAAAAIATWWRPTSIAIDVLADILSAVPATLVAVILIKSLVHADTDVAVLVGALLVVGWAGPCRVIRAELDRLWRAPFSEGARAIGVSSFRLLWRHELPHLIPLLATSLAQQIIASLVLVAELGVLGIVLGRARLIDISASLSTVRTGPEQRALIPDQPEWGILLATSRTVEILWATRWVFLIPGAAFALTAVAVALIGYSLARRYARRDVLADGRGFAIVAALAVLLVAAAPLVPPRYAAATGWAVAASAELRPGSGLGPALAESGLEILPATREIVRMVRTAPAVVRVAGVTAAEPFPYPTHATPGVPVESLVAAGSGGRTVEAPLVFAARGIVPKSYPPLFGYAQTIGNVPKIGNYIQDYPNDYASIDVRGKLVLLVRFMGVESTSRLAAPRRGAGEGDKVEGMPIHETILRALDRGAAGVIYVDPEMGRYTSPSLVPERGQRNPYLDIEREFPATSGDGAPVVVVDVPTATRLVAPLGLDLTPLLGYDREGAVWPRSLARDLGVTARIEVPLRREVETFTSRVALTPGAGGPERIGLWADIDPSTGRIGALQRDVFAAAARFASRRAVRLALVEYDARGGPRAVQEVLEKERITVLLALDGLSGDALQFVTPNGDLIPSLDLYARRAGARAESTRVTATNTLPLLWHVRTVHVFGRTGKGDVRDDVMRLLGYMAGRLALGAPELSR